MRHSETFSVPGDLALLYDFVNSLDLRRYVEAGVAHAPSDQLETPARLDAWLRASGLANAERAETIDHRKALALRDSLRAFIRSPPPARGEAVTGENLRAAAAHFPLAVGISDLGRLTLHPAKSAATSGLGNVLSELYRLAETGRLERLKMCESEECGWVFYDRSKPGNRRWCSSARCGNRQKTRDYRSRQRAL